MRMILLLIAAAACGPIYPAPPPQQQPQPPPPPPQGAQQAPEDPYDGNTPNGPGTIQEWGQRTPPPGIHVGHPAQWDQMPPPEPDRGPAQHVDPPAGRQAPLSADTQQLLDAHNAARARHCAAPLTWSPELAAAAQRWANNLRDRSCAFEHSPNNAFGENLAGGTTGYLDPNGVVAMWYQELGKYDFAHPGFSMETGHFTQVVWRGTTQVGCARASCSAQRQDIWVCEYDPAGNWEGMYPQNVLPTSCRR